jgi:protein-tyrosine phosphatase
MSVCTGITAELSGGNLAIMWGMSGWFRSYGFADVADGLLIGAYPLDQDDVSMLEWMGVERILNLVEDAEYRPGDREQAGAALAAAGIEEHRLSLADYGGLPPEVLEEAVQLVLAWIDEGRRVYLHCRAGWQRSAAVAAGVVAVRDGVDVGEALALVQSRKPSADPLPHQREDLREWWDARSGPAKSAANQPPAADGT